MASKGEQDHNLAAIRKLLLAAFTAEDLERFCQDRAKFRFIVEYFGPGFDKTRMVDAVLEQCRTQALLSDLLEAVQEVNPRQFERYSDQLLMMGGRQRIVNLRPLDMSHTFKDRQREIDALRRYLADSRVRMITVVGRSGMGKTALVCHVLADLEQSTIPIPGDGKELSIDGILYLSAKSTGLSLERIYADVQRMLGEPAASTLAARWKNGDTSSVARVGYLLEAIQYGVYLIVLDNLEDYLTGEGEIADEGLRVFVECCLTQSSGARLIATARQQVHLSGAMLPRIRTISLCEGLPEDDASSLLHELDPQGRLGLRDASEGDLRLTTQLTQGIPRALELVAGILDRDPTASLPRLLANEWLFGEEVVEELVVEGYTRLGNDERRVMEALAVFDRPVEERAISYLLHPWFCELDVPNSLRRLVSGYFVSAIRSTGQYSLHPLDREYAYGQLANDEALNTYGRRNLELRAADFYVSIRKPESGWEMIDDLAPQLAEFEHRVRAGDHDGACRVLTPIDYNYLYMWGHYAQLIEMREKLLGYLKVPQLQAHNLGSLGNAHRRLGEFCKAIELYKDAIAIAREVRDRRNESVWLGRLGSAYRKLGQPEKAPELQYKALSIAREIGARQEEGWHLSNLADAYRDLGQIEKAIDLYGHSLIIAREIGDRRMEATLLIHLGFAHFVLGGFQAAIEFSEQALTIAHDIGSLREKGASLGLLGLTCRELGEPERSIQLLEEALSIARETSDHRNEVVCLSHLGLTYHALGQFDRAITFQEKALVISHEIGRPLETSYQLVRLGQVSLAVGELLAARKYLAEALALDFSDTSHQAALLLGIVLLFQSDPAAGDTFLDASARCRIRLNKTNSLYQVRYILATALTGTAVCNSQWAEKGERGRLLIPALAEYHHALAITSASGVVRDALHDLELIRMARIEGLEPVFELLERA